MDPLQQHCFEQNLCLFCGKTGHIAKECSKATSAAAKAHSTSATDKSSDTKSSMESKKCEQSSSLHTNWGLHWTHRCTHGATTKCIHSLQPKFPHDYLELRPPSNHWHPHPHRFRINSLLPEFHYHPQKSTPHLQDQSDPPPTFQWHHKLHHLLRCWPSAPFPSGNKQTITFYVTPLEASCIAVLGHNCSNYRVEIDAVGIKNLEDLTNRNSSVTVRTLIYW